MLYNGPPCIELPVDRFDWDRAFSAAQQHVKWIIDHNGTIGSHRFWSPLERTARAYLCEIGFARRLGFAWQYEPGIQHRPDVGPYEVKTCAYRRAATMDEFEGGNQHVNKAGVAEVIVMTSCFEATRHERVFLDGWITKTEAARFPSWNRPGERATWRVPYTAFHDPRILITDGFRS